MHRRRVFIAITFAAFTATCTVSLSDDAAARKAIETATQKFVEAFNAGDVKAMAAMWTLEGDFVGENGEKVLFHKQLAGRGTKPEGVKDKDIVRPSLLMTIDSVRSPATDRVPSRSSVRVAPRLPS